MNDRRDFMRLLTLGAVGLIAAVKMPKMFGSVAKKIQHGIFTVSEYNIGGQTPEGFMVTRNSFHPIHLLPGDSLTLTWTFNGYEMSPGPAQKISHK